MQVDKQADRNLTSKAFGFLFAILLLAMSCMRADLVPGSKGTRATGGTKSTIGSNQDLSNSPDIAVGISCLGPAGLLQCDSTGTFRSESELVGSSMSNPFWAANDRLIDFNPPSASRGYFDDPAQFDEAVATVAGPLNAFADNRGTPPGFSGLGVAGFQGSGYFGGYPAPSQNTTGTTDSTSGTNTRKLTSVHLTVTGFGVPAPAPVPTPEPSSLLLLASGLAGFAVVARRKSIIV